MNKNFFTRTDRKLFNGPGYITNKGKSGRKHIHHHWRLPDDCLVDYLIEGILEYGRPKFQVRSIMNGWPQSTPRVSVIFSRLSPNSKIGTHDKSAFSIQDWDSYYTKSDAAAARALDRTIASYQNWEAWYITTVEAAFEYFVETHGPGHPAFTAALS